MQTTLYKDLFISWTKYIVRTQQIKINKLDKHKNSNKMNRTTRALTKYVIGILWIFFIKKQPMSQRVRHTLLRTCGASWEISGSETTDLFSIIYCFWTFIYVSCLDPLWLSCEIITADRQQTAKTFKRMQTVSKHNQQQVMEFWIPFIHLSF